MKKSSLVFLALVFSTVSSFASPPPGYTPPPANPAEVRLGEASVAFDEGDLDLALTKVGEAIAMQAQFPQAYLLKGQVLTKKGEYDQAITALRVALEQKPNFASAKTRLALVLWKKGDSTTAVTLLNEALMLNPSPAFTHYVLGLVYQSQKEDAKAVSAFKNGIRTAGKGEWQ